MSAMSKAQDERDDLQGSPDQTVGSTERWVSVAGGGALALYGLSRRNWSGLVMALAGGGLAYRGLSGKSGLYKLLRITTSGARRSPVASVAHNEGIKVEQTITVNRSPEELFRYWRNFENLPRFMDHLESVQPQGERRSHWKAKAPLGKTVEWDAEIINERPNELIAWRSLDGADISNAGSVHFTPASGGRGTEVRVVMEYSPPLGRVGATVAKIFGEEPEQQVADDLRRFKQVMETGEMATTTGQPNARP